MLLRPLEDLQLPCLPDNSIVDVFFNSFFRFTATITSAFKTMIAREATNVMGNRIQWVVVSFKSHLKFGECGQRITDLTLLEGVVLVSVTFMAMLIWNAEAERSMFDQKKPSSLWSGNALSNYFRAMC